MLKRNWAVFLLVWLIVNLGIQAQPVDDPFLWLEGVEDSAALEWVKARNRTTVDQLQQYSEFSAIKDEILDVINSKDRIAFPSIRGRYVYNFWQDSLHERGVYRRALLEEYFKSDPAWETVLDIDILCRQENMKWVYDGVAFLEPDYDRCLVHLSRGGGDAAVVREFDPIRKEFIPDGFRLDEAKSNVAWKDRNTLWVATDFGSGTLTESGYPRIVKLWKRNTPLDQAKTILEAQSRDMAVSGYTIHTPERNYDIVEHRITFYTGRYYSLEKDSLIRLDFQEDVQFDGIFKNRILLELKSDWNVGGRDYLQGSLISIDYDRFLKGERDFDLIFRPGERESIASVNTTRDRLLINLLKNVSNELHGYTLNDGRWIGQRIDAPALGSISISSTDDQSDRYFFSYYGFLSPTGLYWTDGNQSPVKVKSMPEFFKADGLVTEQWEAVSKDGTRIPYFIVHQREMRLDGTNPTLLEAYGGFEISMTPYYSGACGLAWLSRGGVYVLANLRGGGEFGPSWHLGSIKQNRQNVNDDMIAVMEDLIKRQVTSSRHLGIKGGSNGGLLVGSIFVQRPELCHAVLCQVPLLDMQRYNKLLAGASWVGEYGNPDIPEEWQYIKNYSPYHNLAAGKPYPKIFFTTSTRDDRVHPGHARKMAAKLESMAIPFFYYENTEGGHSSGVTNAQRAFQSALGYAYLWMQLK
ncbi:MAG: S9 family peptidase [Candidatus Delongbacteria bacterium]|nr:S9 family peptidase [Candidatus Delongbacteria bacterium]